MLPVKLLIVRHTEPDYERDSLTEKGWREAAFFPNVWLRSLPKLIMSLRWEERGILPRPLLKPQAVPLWSVLRPPQPLVEHFPDDIMARLLYCAVFRHDCCDRGATGGDRFFPYAGVWGYFASVRKRRDTVLYGKV